MPLCANTRKVIYKKIWNHNPNQTRNTNIQICHPWSLDTFWAGANRVNNLKQYSSKVLVLFLGRLGKKWIWYIYFHIKNYEKCWWWWRPATCLWGAQQGAAQTKISQETAQWLLGWPGQGEISNDCLRRSYPWMNLYGFSNSTSLRNWNNCFNVFHKDGCKMNCPVIVCIYLKLNIPGCLQGCWLSTVYWKTPLVGSYKVFDNF